MPAKLEAQCTKHEARTVHLRCGDASNVEPPSINSSKSVPHSASARPPTCVRAAASFEFYQATCVQPSNSPSVPRDVAPAAPEVLPHPCAYRAEARSSTSDAVSRMLSTCPWNAPCRWRHRRSSGPGMLRPKLSRPGRLITADREQVTAKP